MSFLRWALSIFISVVAVKSQAGCLAQHIHEAMELNKKRAPVYESLSEGQSQIVSKKLIWMEQKLSLVAPFADLWAAPYRRAGIPILCADFVDMSEVPAFKAFNPEGAESLDNFHAPDVVKLKRDLLNLYKAKAHGDLALYADAQIRELDKNPRYNCMVKHILESIRRIAALAPRYEQMAQQKNKFSPLSLSRMVLRSHILLLDESAQIDFHAAPLQADALPIVCQDVPHIPWP